MLRKSLESISISISTINIFKKKYVLQNNIDI